MNNWLHSLLAQWHEQVLELTKPASLKSTSMETTTVVVHESMIGSHHCSKTGKIAILLGETLASTVKVKSPIGSLHYAVAIEDHNICSHVAGYQKLVREQILAILGVDNSRLSDQYYYRLY